jgi:hypothetical protein
MIPNGDIQRAFWACAGFTLLSGLVSAAFSLRSLGMSGGHEDALYAASRSIALPLATIVAMVTRSRGGVAAMAATMTFVQFFDAWIGFEMRNPGRAFGPLSFAVLNIVLLLWMRANAPAE